MYIDAAITKDEDDKLNRLEFVNNLSDTINKYNKDECLVIGLLGEWGSGKTSLINLSLNKIKEKYIVVKFNPWLFSQQNDLIYKFFEELIDVITHKEEVNEDIVINEDDSRLKTICSKINSNKSYFITKKDKNHKIKESLIHNLKDFFNKSVTSGHISLSTVNGSTITIGGSFSPNWDYNEDVSDKSLETLKEEINNNLLELETKIIVVIDDIDRLTDFEVKQIFRLVKSLADFKNLIYILSFDKKMVVESLCNEQVYNPDKYLEKIIQIPIEVPKIEDYSLENYFAGELNPFNDKIDFETFQYLNYFMTNVRDIKRFMNHLGFYCNFLEGEVNFQDFLLVLALQLFESDIFHKIYSNKDFFIELKDNYDNAKKEKDREFYNILIKPVHLKVSEMNIVISRLFPKFNFIINRYSPDPLDSLFYRQQLRICDKETFDRYFTFSLSKIKLSDKLVTSILSSNDMEWINNEVFELNKSNKTRDFLWNVVIRKDEIPLENIPNFVEFFLNIGDLLDFTPNHIFESKDIFLSRIVHDLLYRLETQEERYVLLKEIIPKLDKSINSLVHFIGIEDQVHGRYFSKTPSKSKSEYLITDDQLSELEKLTAKNIKKWADDSRLINEKDLAEILYDWSLWENKDVVIEFIEKHIVDVENLTKLIKGFEKITTDLVANKNPVKYDKSYYFDTLEKFIDLTDLKVQIQTIDGFDDSEEINHFLSELDKYLANIQTN